jgi:hypothetical protein
MPHSRGSSLEAFDARMGRSYLVAPRKRRGRNGTEHGHHQSEASREAELDGYRGREDELLVSGNAAVPVEGHPEGDDYAGQCSSCGRHRFDLQLLEYARSGAWWVCRVCFDRWCDEWLIPPDAFTTATV